MLIGYEARAFEHPSFLASRQFDNEPNPSNPMNS